MRNEGRGQEDTLSRELGGWWSSHLPWALEEGADEEPGKASEMAPATGSSAWREERVAGVEVGRTPIRVSEDLETGGQL